MSKSGSKKHYDIIDVTQQFSCIWDEIALCETMSDNLPVCILNTGKKEWILLKNRDRFCIEIDGIERHMWIGKPIPLSKVTKLTGQEFAERTEEMESVSIIYARCEKSMKLLDPLIRQYALDIEYEHNMVYAIKSVAGSGKTTTLVNLAKKNNDKKILYLAFNRAIVQEIKKKRIKNLFPKTFDALIRALYINRYPDEECCIQELRAYTMGKIYPWFANKPFKMKKNFVTKYNNFCKNIEHDEMFEFIENTTTSKFAKKQLLQMWQDTKSRRLITFSGLRKMAFVQHWFRDYIDANYDMVFIDEAQDFDPLMLEMLIHDTTVPKIFVGDPRQAIYEWRGAINAFEKFPEDAFVMEFYTTWRIGNPACEKIRGEFRDCWMIAGNDHTTNLYNDSKPSGKYDYLFRKWRSLLEEAKKTPKVWINDFAKKKSQIERLHKNLKKYGMSKEDKAEFEDDLPNYLLELGEYELRDLINKIEANSVQKRCADVRMYTIHAYKGMENDNVRVFNDINHETEENIYYVALTRGKHEICVNAEEEVIKTEIYRRKLN